MKRNVATATDDRCSPEKKHRVAVWVSLDVLLPSPERLVLSHTFLLLQWAFVEAENVHLNSARDEYELSHDPNDMSIRIYDRKRPRQRYLCYINLPS